MRKQTTTITILWPNNPQIGKIQCASLSRPRRQHLEPPRWCLARIPIPKIPNSPAMPKRNHCARAAFASASAAASSPGRPARHKSKTQIKEGEEKGSSTVPAMYDANADIEEEYRLFLENVRVHENEDFVVEYEGKVIRYGGDQAVADGGGSREDLVKEKKKVTEVAVISSDNVSMKSVPEPNPLDSCASRRKAKKVVDQEKMDEKNEAASLLKGKGVEKVIEMKVEDERLVLALPKPGTTTSLTNTSDSHETEPHTTSQSHGIIWPTYINDREESHFKHGLIEALSKPFCQGEYDKLYGMATVRLPLKRERRTRSGEKTYYSDLCMGKSYFDCYPDLAEQVEETSYPKRLALLRGLFYWLKNIGQEHQFRPWTNQHIVIHL